MRYSEALHTATVHSSHLQVEEEEESSEEESEDNGGDVLPGNGVFEVMDWQVPEGEDETIVTIAMAKTKSMMQWANVKNNPNLALSKVFSSRDAPWASGMLKVGAQCVLNLPNLNANYLDSPAFLPASCACADLPGILYLACLNPLHTHAPTYPKRWLSTARNRGRAPKITFCFST